MAKSKTKINETKGDRALHAFTTLMLLFVTVIVGYPVIYVISSSFSSSAALNAGRVVLWPVDFSTASYEFVFRYQQVWTGYRNTIFYTIGCTLVSLFLIVTMAYPLSKRYYQGRKFVTALIIAAMLTSAGLIPSYILKDSLGMVDTVWAIILSGALSFRSVIVLRTAFQTGIPGELFDAAEIDGANDIQCLVQLAIPLAKATLSVVSLWTIVGAWNEYFNAMIYLHDRSMWPLQLFLREIMTAGQTIDASSVSGSDMLAMLDDGTAGIKYALIVMSTVPVLVLYAFVQKFFKKGVMIGSVKG